MQSYHFNANRWGNSGNSNRLYFFGVSKITANGDCSHEIKTHAPWKENYDKPIQRMKKQRRHFVNKGPIMRAMVFPLVMYGSESWTIKKTDS